MSEESAAPLTKRSVSEATKKVVAARGKWRCYECDRLLASTYQIDHTLPLWEGGTNTMSNLRALCVSCHAAKTQLEGIRRAQKLKEKIDAALLQKKRDEREDYVVVRNNERVLQCQTCLKTRPITEGWDTHRCPRLYF